MEENGRPLIRIFFWLKLAKALDAEACIHILPPSRTAADRSPNSQTTCSSLEGRLQWTNQVNPKSFDSQVL